MLGEPINTVKKGNGEGEKKQKTQQKAQIQNGENKIKHLTTPNKMRRG